ncbi:CHAT domain-containing protein [Microcoleus sp. EPA2]|uniref:CHAT domain-containing protein n=1 Tax=Microcoleus sp. EPA2 TaxID=2841654 RepID=UPI00312B4924
MKNANLKIKKVCLFISPFSLLIFNTFAQAQTVIPAADGTGTNVTRTDNRYDIGGGSLSGDGANLFHSFQKFGIPEGQVANFLTNPAIQNILGRISGGDASLINGLITVTGGNSNLFLINPAGIVFGPNASLNVPAAFTATTASGVGFGSNWFNATGINDFSTLVGTPNGFYFGVAPPGSIVNAANLAVAPGQSLALLGGTVISTGNLSAPGGNITVASVGSGSAIRISQPGHLLSLEIATGGNLPNSPLLANPLSLPQLLTGSGVNGATGVAVATDGTVRLVGSGLQVNSGDVAIAKSNLTPISDLTAANARLWAANNLTLDGVQLYTSGNLTLTAGNAAQVRDSATHPFLAQAGGNLYIQGDRTIDILTQNAIGALALAPQFQAGGALTLVSNGVISGDTHFVSGGNFSIRNLSGMPGNFVSLFDPIISSEADVFLGDYTGASLKVEAKGSIVAQDITITRPDTALDIGNVSADSDIAILTRTPALILRAGVRNLANTPNVPNAVEGSFDDNETTSLGEEAIFNPGIINSTPLIIVDNLSAGGLVSLSAPGTVATRDINSGEIKVESGQGVVVGGRLTSSSTINIQAADNIILTNDISRGDVNGNVSFNSSGGSIVTGAIDTGNSGAIELRAFGNVNFGNLQGTKVDVASNSGELGVLSDPNVIVPNTIPVDIAATTNISLRASRDLTVGNLNAATVNATSNTGNVTTGAIATTGDVRILARQVINTGVVTVNSVGLNFIPTVNLDAQTNIATPSINAPAATIAVRASRDLNIGNLQGGAVDVSSDGGQIAIGNSVTTGNINVAASGNVKSGILQGLRVNVKSDSGSIETANTTATLNVNLAAAGDVNAAILRGVAVDVNSSRGSVTTGNINATETVGVLAGRQITVGRIDVNSVGGDRTATVNLNARNDISVASINATGGTVAIGTPGFVRITNSFLNQNGTPVSISTVGANRPGSVTINHGGANTNPPTPFAIGDARINGSAAAIDSGNVNIIPPTPTPPTPTPPPPPTPTPPPPTPTPPPPTPTPPPPPTPTPLTPPTPLNRFLSLFPGPNQALTPEQLLNQNIILRNIEAPRQMIVGLEKNLPPKAILDFIRSNPPNLAFLSAFRSNIGSNFDQGKLSEGIALLDKSFSQEYQQYFGLNFPDIEDELISTEATQKKLAALSAETGIKPSFIYLFSRPEKLDLVLITASGSVIHQTVPQANRKELMQLVSKFREEITKLGARGTTSYLPYSQQLYQWIIAPLQPTLKERGIDTISFIADKGLRGFPFSALHDGQQFLVENYNISLIPSVSLTDTRYIDIRNVQVLAMGASQFSELKPLPAVPAEIAAISRDWPGISFLNEGFTLENLRRQHQSRPFGIIHLATHGEFKPGLPSNSFIQLWNSRLQLDQLRQLRLNDPQVNLLVLSACRTAVGDEEAELGFGGLAVQSGVQTALGSLWYVSDEGTLGLMSEFYQQLKTAPIRAAALRKAQIAMLRGDVRLEGGQLRGSSRGGGVDLPPSLRGFADTNLSHPFYWSAFVMVGSPW